MIVQSSGRNVRRRRERDAKRALRGFFGELEREAFFHHAVDQLLHFVLVRRRKISSVSFSAKAMRVARTMDLTMGSGAAPSRANAARAPAVPR